MKLSLNKISSIAALALLASVLPSTAQVYAKTSTVEAFQAKDQFGNPYAFDAKSTRYLLVSHDMDTGKKANASLTALGKEFLPGKKAIFMANIQGMPAVGRMFAIPKMKKYSHRIILADDAALIAHMPEQKGKVTVLSLKNGKVSDVQYWDPASENVSKYLN